MVVGAKVCDLTEDLLWFVCGNVDVFPKQMGKALATRLKQMRHWYLGDRYYVCMGFHY